MADTKEMAMRRRLNALLRKTTLPESATHGESLVNLLVTHIRTKAEYEALLGEGDGAEVFARRNGLVPEHEKLLLELQVCISMQVVSTASPRIWPCKGVLIQPCCAESERHLRAESHFR